MVGLGMSVMLFAAFNQSVWKKCDPRPILYGKNFAVLMTLAIFLIILVLTENPMILYPLSLISAGGVLMLLTLVYAIVWIMLLRLENRFEHFHQLVFPLMAGFVIALLQILIIDGLRYWVTGTWGGFPLE
jgi:hypothetical protein